MKRLHRIYFVRQEDFTLGQSGSGNGETSLPPNWFSLCELGVFSDSVVELCTESLFSWLQSGFLVKPEMSQRLSMFLKSRKLLKNALEPPPANLEPS
jgi:hypothetical protein